MKRIELDDRIAEGLLALAASRQMSVSECLQAIITHETESLRSSRPPQADEVEAELEALLFDGPSLPKDFSREDVYADHH